MATVLLTSTVSARAATLDTAIACRPDIVVFVPRRIQDICASLEEYRKDRNMEGKIKRDAETGDGHGEAPEHLFLRFGRTGHSWIDQDK